MAPSWMPQNIQKRVFKYVLNKLAVFSNLDLENLDVSLGRTSNLSVNDVELDTEKLSIPGVYVRQGGVRKLNVQLGVVSGVKLEGSDIEATVAISQYPPNEDDQDLSALLSKTTNDIAESIMVKEAKKGLVEEGEVDEEADDNGYGMGEFSTLVSRLVDAAMAQLIVELRNIVIHIVANESIKMDLLIDEILFSTGDDGLRHATVNGTRLVLIEHDSAAQQSGYEPESDSGDSDEDESELMQSTVFSREEASTMYMSALSDMADNEPKIVQRPVLECNSLKFSFSGIAGANLQVEIASVLGTVESFPDALIPLVRFANNYLFVASETDESDELPVQREECKYEVDADMPQNFSLKKLAISSVKLKLGDQTESDTYCVLSDIIVTHKDDLFLEVRKVKAIRGENPILWFANDEEEPNSDFICKIKPLSTTYLLPNSAMMDVAFEDLVLLGDCVDDLILVTAELGVDEKCEKGPELTKPVSAQTNTFSLKLDTGVNVVSVTVLPLSFESESGLRIGRIKGKINNNEILEIDPGTLCVSNMPETIVRRQDSEEVSTQVMKKLLVDKVALKLSERSLVGIFSDVKRLQDHLVDHRAAKMPSLKNEEGRFRNVRISEDATVGPVELAISIKSIEFILELEGKLGTFNLDFRDLDANFFQNKVQSTFGTVNASRDFSDIDPEAKYVSLIHTANPLLRDRPMMFIELSNGKLSEVRLWNMSVEYHVRLLKLFETEDQDMEKKEEEKEEEEEEEEEEEDKTPRPETQHTQKVNTSLDDSTSTIRNQEIKFPMYLIDCVIGLTPFDMPSKAQLIIRDATSEVQQNIGGEISMEVFIRKAALCLIDDVQYIEGTGKEHHSRLGKYARHHSSLDQVNFFLKQGYVPVASLSSIFSKLHLTDEEEDPRIKLELSSELLVLETCPDSTQTLIQLLNELKPPIEGGEEIKYHTEVLPVNLLEDIDERAFNDPERPVIAETDLNNVDFVSDDLPSNLDFVESYYADKASKSTWNNSPSVSLGTPGEYSKADLLLDQDLSILAQRSTSGTVKDGSVVQPNDSSQRKFAVFEQRAHSHESMLDIAEDHFSRTHSDILVDSGTSSGQSVYDDEVMINSSGEQSSAERSPPRTTHGRKQLIPKVRVEVNKVKRVTWNLHDGYDWTHTQDIINGAVDRVETRATEAHKRALDESARVDEEEDGNGNVVIERNEGQADSQDTKTEPQVIGDLLFNSIYIGIPSGQDPTDLRREINKEINDEATSVAGATTVTTGADSRSRSPKRRYSSSTTHSRESLAKKLKLKRSRTHKVKIELYDFAADAMIYAGVNDREKTTTGTVAGEEGELLNRVDMRIRDLEIIDNVPTSTWNKFVTYMRSSGDRESDASMVHIIMDNVKPIADIATSEAILNVFVLPLRLHVDQDTLDFLTRFFEFKDERFLENDSKDEEILFIQKVDIRSIKVKLDYKPKKVDYRGLKSGHITEFMNFFILDEAEMVLRRTVLYGVPGIARLAQMLHSIWMPDIRTTQLGDVLAGIAPVRSLLRLGSGVKDLVVVPVREYRKDGRIIRSLQKGAWTFARNTTNEMVKFGAKLAAGTQTILESAEQAMGGTGAAGRNSQEEEGSSHHRRRHISAYSDDLGEEDLAESYYIENPDEADNEHAQNGKKAVSLYANQPTGVAQGLQVAYTSLGRNFALAKEAVSDIGTQTADRGGNAQDAARAVVKAAPIALIRPVIGATEAVSKTLLGVTNQIDSNQMQNAEDKYKSDRQDDGSA